MLKDLTLTDQEFLPPLRIERLARLNLLVGKNGVGKTAVLTAIYEGAEPFVEWIGDPRGPEDVAAGLWVKDFRGYMMLIDGIAQGLHHTKMADLWRYWCKAALEFDLQVFASTHSWDCIKGFAAALEENPEVDGMVIRLEHKPEWDRMRAVRIDQEELPIVIREQIEIR